MLFSEHLRDLLLAKHQKQIGALETISAVISASGMTGNAGKLLTTDGSDASWSNTVTANAADAVGLVVNGISGQTANLQEWYFNGTRKCYISKDGIIETQGTICTTGNFAVTGSCGLMNDHGTSYTLFNASDNGAIISRNRPDAYSALTVNQINASSTGNILTLQFGGANKASFDKNGILITSGYKSSDGSAGATGSFTTADSKTVTVKNGLITSIV